MNRYFRVHLSTTAFVLGLLTVALPIRGDETPKADAKPDRSTIRWTCDVEGAIDDVWAAFTTKEGIESWMVPIAEVDLRIGGTIKTNYNKSAGIGGPGTIVHHILSLEPMRMISSRFDAPENAQAVKIAEKAWGITYFDSLAPKKTRVTVVACGYGEGPEWDTARAFFEKGNDYTLEKLKERFKKDPAEKAASGNEKDVETAAPDALNLLSALVGEWAFEKKQDNGKVFRGRSAYELGPDGKNLIARGSLGDEKKLSPHGAMQIFRDPASKEVRFLNLDENGGVAQGAVRVSSPKVLEWDWDLVNSKGSLTRYIVRQTLKGPDEFDFQLFLRSSEQPNKELVHVTYRRVS